MPTIPVQTRLAAPSAFAPAPPPSIPVGAVSSPGFSSSAFLPSALPERSATLDLHIDALVLHGFSGVDGRRVGVAFEQELARLLAQSESPLSEYAPGAAALADSTAGDSASAPLAAEFAPGRPELTGRRAARALHARLRA